MSAITQLKINNVTNTLINVCNNAGKNNVGNTPINVCDDTSKNK